MPDEDPDVTPKDEAAPVEDDGRKAVLDAASAKFANEVMKRLKEKSAPKEPAKRVVQLEKAWDLLSWLQPIFGRIKGLRGTWLFRGQSHADLPMVPAALRRGARLVGEFGRLATSDPGERTFRQQLEAEYSTLKLFFERADEQGLLLPGDDAVVRAAFFSRDGFESLADPEGDGEYDWPPPTLHALLGLAQHFGLPTRLLDWSRNPHMAMYFAAVEAAEWASDAGRAAATFLERGLPSPTHLSVWAYRPVATRWMSLADLLPGIKRATARESIEPIRPPTASNRNLHAQEGVLLLHRQVLNREMMSKPVLVSPFDSLLEDRIAREGGATETQLYQLRLPVTEAPMLLYLLAEMGVDGAAAFPGPEGVVKALRERHWWWSP